jgi:hypothetical protein
MAWDKTPWAPPLVELEVGIAGHPLAWERHERDGSWWAWVSWIHESGGRRDHKVVLVRADSLRPLEPPEAYKAVRAGFAASMAYPQSIARPGVGISARHEARKAGLGGRVVQQPSYGSSTS